MSKCWNCGRKTWPVRHGYVSKFGIIIAEGKYYCEQCEVLWSPTGRFAY